MAQLRITYNLGTDENGRPILRRQTLPALDSATIDQLQTVVNNIASVVQPPIEEAQKITFENVI